jgi:branched-chain amino acid transport system permease protein
LLEVTRRLDEHSWQNRMIRLSPYIASCIILVLLPLVLPPYAQNLMTKFIIYAIFAMSLNILVGYAGLPSLGHAAFFGVAGYTTAILAVNYGVKSFWLTMPASIVSATFLAAIFGIIALRVSGIYFLLVTFALGQLPYSIAVKWFSVTGGSYGLGGIPLPDLGFSGLTWNDLTFYYFTFLVFIICFLLLYRLLDSPFGHILQGIREGEHRMIVLGYNTWRYKYIAFVAAGLFAGVAGVLFAHYNTIISPDHLGFQTSGLVLLMVIMGGAGTLFGPVIGSAVIVMIQYFASIWIPERWPLILGGAFVLVVMWLRGGFSTHLIKLWVKVTRHHGSPTY